MDKKYWEVLKKALKTGQAVLISFGDKNTKTGELYEIKKLNKKEGEIVVFVDGDDNMIFREEDVERAKIIPTREIIKTLNEIREGVEEKMDSLRVFYT